MPAILAFLRAFASTAFLYPLIARVLVGLGISAITYAGVHVLEQSIVDHFIANASGLGGDMLVIIKMLGVFKAVSVTLSAYSAKLALSGLTAAGTLRRITWTGQGPIVLNP